MHVSRFHAAERGAEAASRAAAVLGSDRSSRDDFNDLRAIASEVRFFAAGMADNDDNLKSGAITLEQHVMIKAKLERRLLTYMTPTE